MPGMPLEADRLETLGGLLDKQLVFADGTERPQGEWLKVGAALQERRSLPLDHRPLLQRRERVEASRRRRQGVRVRDAREVT